MDRRISFFKMNLHCSIWLVILKGMCYTNHLLEKEQRSDGDKLHLSYAEDLEISSTNDTMQSPERVRYFLSKSTPNITKLSNFSSTR